MVGSGDILLEEGLQGLIGRWRLKNGVSGVDVL